MGCVSSLCNSSPSRARIATTTTTRNGSERNGELSVSHAASGEMPTQMTQSVLGEEGATMESALIGRFSFQKEKNIYIYIIDVGRISAFRSRRS